jgi:nicotinamidase-related amidase
LLVCCVASEIIVEHSALSAATQGFQVQIVVDACGGLSHCRSLRDIRRDSKKRDLEACSERLKILVQGP